MKPSLPRLPFDVPPFDVTPPAVPVTFTWWSWHPLYPYWSKSCWSGPTVEEAMTKLDRLGGFYYNVLVREDSSGMVVVKHEPPRAPEVWWRIYYHTVNEARRSPEEVLEFVQQRIGHLIP